MCGFVGFEGLGWLTIRKVTRVTWGGGAKMAKISGGVKHSHLQEDGPQKAPEGRMEGPLPPNGEETRGGRKREKKERKKEKKGEKTGKMKNSGKNNGKQ